MNIIAIDSSGLTASVAVLKEDNLLAEYTVNYKKTHSQTLLPMLHEIQQMTELNLADVDAIAVAAGPGSFTGLRIGSATAKGLGLALNKPLIPVSTLAGLAYQCFGSSRMICPLMDARRSQVYTAFYECGTEELKTVLEPSAISVEEMIKAVNESGRPVLYLGDGVDVYSDILKKETKVDYLFAPAHMNKQRAGAIAALAKIYLKQGKVQDPKEHRPEYLRLSQAERERLEAEKGS